MSRETWSAIKQSKNFYVNTYRRAGTILLFSMLINMLLALCIYFFYMNRPDNNFYATSGVTSPIILTPLDSPNYTSVPLLSPDIEEENINKPLPE